MKAVRYDDISTNWTRAVQVFGILICKAANQQTITYGKLCGVMAWGEAKGLPLRHPLGAIWRWCEARDLPLLNQLVVNAQTGLPGDGALAEDAVLMQRKAFAYPWHTIVPPTADELEALYRAFWPRR